MSSADQRWFFGRLSTGAKFLLILSLGLFPFGLIAVLASVESARENRAEQAQRIRGQLIVKAQRIDNALSRSVLSLRAAAYAIPPDASAEQCRATLQRLTRAEALPARYALARGSDWRCATPGYSPAPIRAAARALSAVEIGQDGRSLRFAFYGPNGDLEGTGEFSRTHVAELTQLNETAEPRNVRLIGIGREMMLQNGLQGGAFRNPLVFVEPVAAGRLKLELVTTQAPMSAAELIVVLLPVMMWIAAAAVGWLLVDRLLLRPLIRMERAVASYQPGDRSLDLPVLRSPAREIADLGAAFSRVTRTVAQHEADLELGLERQTKLVREVHHRVKNNLQVVASLLNLHARGAKSEDASAAYASIQRRVDALAVVHRNHFAELEDNRGVALKPLISELAANLRANAPASAAKMQIRLHVEPYYVTQDVAVSVAFLITEIVEFAMFCGGMTVTISLDAHQAGAAMLSIESEALREGAKCDEDLMTRFDRIVTGLSRQLRSVIDKNGAEGRFSLVIAVVDKAEH